MWGSPRRAVPLRDGRIAVLRRMEAADLPRWKKMIMACSVDTIFRRFERRSYQAVISEVEELFDADSLVIIAEIENDVVGEARICLIPGEKAAEFCVLVADPWQGLGVGAALTDFALELACAAGLEKILVEIVPENAKILDFLRRRGFRFITDARGCAYRGELILRVEKGAQGRKK